MVGQISGYMLDRHIINSCGIQDSLCCLCACHSRCTAVLTYVASAAAAILQLLRLVLLFGGRDRD
jgi:Zn-dependent membrane protease YugP